MTHPSVSTRRVRTALTAAVLMAGAGTLAFAAGGAVGTGEGAGDRQAADAVGPPLRLAQTNAGDTTGTRDTVSEILGSGRLGLTADAMIDALGTGTDGTAPAPETAGADPVPPQDGPQDVAGDTAVPAAPVDTATTDTTTTDTTTTDMAPDTETGGAGDAPVRADAAPATVPAWPDTVPALSGVETVASLSLSEEARTSAGPEPSASPEPSSAAGTAVSRPAAPRARTAPAETTAETATISVPWTTGVYR